MTDTTTLPIAPMTFWLLVILVALVLAILIAAVAKPADPTGPSSSAWSRFLTRIGLDKVPPVAALFVSLFWVALALTLAGGILATIYTVPSALATSTSNPDDATLRWTLLTLTALTGALGAVVALPFTLIRIRQTQRQTDLQDEALFNDKINAAATDLAARRQVTRVLHKGTPDECIATEWEDDLVTRAAAIDRLEGLAIEAIEREDYRPAQRIARMLSIYVQELSRAYPAIEPPKDAKPDLIHDWASSLSPVRPDMERAVQSLGRINPEEEVVRTAFNPEFIDLRRCNLQAFDLRILNLQGIQLAHGQLQGAYLVRAQLQGATLIGAQLQGATFIGAQLQGADLYEAQLQGAELVGANLSEDTVLDAAILQGTAFRLLEAATLKQLRAFWDDIIMFADTVPDDSPDHWVHVADDDFDYDTFITQWRAWAATLDPPVTIAPDYRGD